MYVTSSEICQLGQGTGTVGLGILLSALWMAGLLAIGWGWYGCSSCSIDELILAVQRGDWRGTLYLVVGLLCSWVPGCVAMLSCGVFLVWVRDPENLQLSAAGGLILVSFITAIWLTPYQI